MERPPTLTHGERDRVRAENLPTSGQYLDVNPLDSVSPPVHLEATLQQCSLVPPREALSPGQIFEWEFKVDVSLPAQLPLI